MEREHTEREHNGDAWNLENLDTAWYVLFDLEHTGNLDENDSRLVAYARCLVEAQSRRVTRNEE